jgi:flagellar protein FlaJ
MATTPKRLQDILNQVNDPAGSSPESQRSRKPDIKPQAKADLGSSTDVDVRVERVRAGVEGTGVTAKPIDISRADFSRYSNNPNIKAIGELYQSISGILSQVSKLLAAFPMAAQLRSSLKCAGYKMDAETYVAIVSTLAFTGAIFMMLLAASIGVVVQALDLSNLISTSMLSILIGLISFVLICVLGLMYPDMVGKSRATAVDRELPFALRHLATQMGAGVSFQRALSSVADSDYGILSEELKYAIGRMESGLSTEDALLEVGNRTYSDGLKQAVIQIVRALKTGGKISEIITSIAEDVAFETRMKVRDFTESLNLVSIIFIMIAVVAPVVVTLMAAIMQLPLLGGGVSPIIIIGIFAALVFAMFAVIIMIKQLEPMSS